MRTYYESPDIANISISEGNSQSCKEVSRDVSAHSTRHSKKSHDEGTINIQRSEFFWMSPISYKIENGN